MCFSCCCCFFFFFLGGGGGGGGVFRVAGHRELWVLELGFRALWLLALCRLTACC